MYKHLIELTITTSPEDIFLTQVECREKSAIVLLGAPAASQENTQYSPPDAALHCTAL